jgi:hypothetical protein
MINNKNNNDETSLTSYDNTSMTNTVNDASLLLNNIKLNNDETNLTSNNASIVLKNIKLNNNNNNMLSISELTEVIFDKNVNDVEIESESEDENENENYKDKNILIYFKMSGCGACMEFEKIWYNVIKDHTNISNLKFSEVNALGKEHEQHITSHYKINKFPTLLLIKRSNKQALYDGDMFKSDDIKKFLLDNLN